MLFLICYRIEYNRIVCFRFKNDLFCDSDKNQLDLTSSNADGSHDTPAVTKALLDSTAEESAGEGASQDTHVDEDDTGSKGN